MQTKAAINDPFVDGKGASAWVMVYFELVRLKNLYRQGWLRRGIHPDRCESVAEHSFTMSLLAWWLADAYYPELDSGRVMRLALVHDLGEIYAGDLIPEDRIDPQEKHRQEEEAVLKVSEKIPGGDRYTELWAEFEEQSSPEARFVRQIDRLEMALQASAYEYQGYTGLQEFFDTTAGDLQDTILNELFQGVLHSRIDSPSTE